MSSHDVQGDWPFDRAAKALRRELSALEANEQRLRTILEHAPVMIDSFDRAGRCRLWNDECERRLGWTRGEIRALDDPLALTYPDPEERARVRRAIEEADGKFRKYEVRAKDGSLRIQWWASFRLDSGEQIACGYDVTDQDEAVEALRQSESRYRALVEALPDSVLRVRRDGTCLDLAAGAGLEVLGLDAHSVGRRVQDVLPARLLRRGAAAVERVLRSAGAVSRTMEYRWIQPGGSRCFEARFVASGRDEVVAIVRDVTERKSIEERLRQSQKLEALGRLAGGLAHDFNNLLTVILGNVEMLRATLDLAAGSGAEALLDGIGKAARGGSRRIRKLLAFSRGYELERVRVPLGEKVREALAPLSRLLPESIEVVVDLPAGGGPEILADPDAVEQIVINLATNARDAMPHGGTLRIQAGPGSRLLPGVGKAACLRVEDSGAGIPAASRARVFDPFFTTKPPERGSGLGLAIVYGLVRQHQGEVELESEPGRGTAISVYLPMLSERRPAPCGPSDVARGEPRAGAPTVLVVEDEEGVRNLARQTLGNRGYRVLVAADGLEALEVLAGHPEVELVLSDVVMPRLGGRELLERARESAPGLRFLLMTGYAKSVSRPADGVPVLVKPWTPSQLASRVRELLETPTAD